MAFSVFTAPGAGLASSSGGTLTLTRPSSGRKQKGALTVDSYYCKRLRPLFWWSPGGAASGVNFAARPLGCAAAWFPADCNNAL